MICPLTNKLINYPLLAADKCIYQKSSIQLWFRLGNTHSLVTQQIFNHYQLQKIEKPFRQIDKVRQYNIQQQQEVQPLLDQQQQKSQSYSLNRNLQFCQSSQLNFSQNQSYQENLNYQQKQLKSKQKVSNYKKIFNFKEFTHYQNQQKSFLSLQIKFRNIFNQEKSKYLHKNDFLQFFQKQSNNVQINVKELDCQVGQNAKSTIIFEQKYKQLNQLAQNVFVEINKSINQTLQLNNKQKIQKKKQIFQNQYSKLTSFFKFKTFLEKLKYLFENQKCKIKNFKNGIYFGQLKNRNTRHGLGYFKIKNQQQQFFYQWISGKLSGFALHQRKLKSSYKGYFKNDVRQGHGIAIWPSGNKYFGQWKKDKMNGFGHFYEVQKVQGVNRRYQGFLVNQQYQGVGRMIYSNGKIVTDIFLINNSKKREQWTLKYKIKKIQLFQEQIKLSF